MTKDLKEILDSRMKEIFLHTNFWLTAQMLERKHSIELCKYFTYKLRQTDLKGGKR